MRVRSKRSMASLKRLVGVLIVGEQGLRTGQGTQAPVRSAGACAFFEPLHRQRGGFLFAGARRSFDQFEQTPTVEAEVLVFTSLASGGECLLVSAEPVVKDGGGVSGHAEHTAFTPGGSVRGGRLDQADRVGRNPPPGSQRQ